MKAAEFFFANPVFRHEEFLAACYPGVGKDCRAAERVLAHHVSVGRVQRIRRGLYMVNDPRAAVSTFHVAAKLAPDAVLAYHTALEYAGHAYSLWHERLIMTSTQIRAFEFQNCRFRSVGIPAALGTESSRSLGVETHEHAGLKIRVTSLERTLVDMLDRPEYSGGWEELWHCFEGVGFVDPHIILQHVRNLGSRTTAARVGWFIEQHRDRWLISDDLLGELEELRPQVPVYIERSQRRQGELHPRWNLMIPASVSTRQWAVVL